MNFKDQKVKNILHAPMSFVICVASLIIIVTTQVI